MVAGLTPSSRWAAMKRETLKPGMRVGLYGGSFDPLHAAHLHVARTALKRLRLDRVWWLVSPGNPLKAHAPAPLRSRVAALERVVSEPRMVITDIEARAGTHRTLDLVRYLQEHHPGVEFAWIMGGDGLAEFHRWHGWREIKDRLPVCVIARPGAGFKARLGPAARQMRAGRKPENGAHTLLSTRSGWTYLTEPLHPHASRLMRSPPTPETTSGPIS